MVVVRRAGPGSACWPARSGRSRAASFAGRAASVPRTIASVIRAARTLACTSWTRTMSTPAAMPSAVVASVASSRSSAGRSRTRPSVDFRLVPSRIGRPSMRSAVELAQQLAGCAPASCRNRTRDRRSGRPIGRRAAARARAPRWRSAMSSGRNVAVARLGAVVHDDERARRGRRRAGRARRPSPTPQTSLMRSAPAASAASATAGLVVSMLSGVSGQRARAGPR